MSRPTPRRPTDSGLCHHDPVRRTVALTGGIASGKSAVSAILTDLGAIVIDSDVLAREVVEPGTPALNAIAERFGGGVLGADGTLDRAGLGEIVFADARARADLNAIVHPAVRSRAAELTLTAPRGAIVVNVIPLLVETGLADNFDLILVVDCDEEVQLERLMARSGLDRGQALARLAAQATRAERLEVADAVIDNSGPPEALRPQVEAVWRSVVDGSLRGPEA